MLAQWPGLFIHWSIVSAAVGEPAAMFSPTADQSYPAAVTRSAGSRPSGSRWSKNPWSAMFRAWLRAADRSSACMTSGEVAPMDVPPHTAPLARCSLTRASTSHSKDCAAEGQLVPSGGGHPPSPSLSLPVLGSRALHDHRTEQARRMARGRK